MRMKKDGIKILPKVGFHLWQNHFLRWNSRRLRGLEDSAKDLRGCKGGLPVLAEKPNKAFFGQRWAFPCLTGFEASRRLNLSLYGAKVGFFLSDCLKRLIRWASSLRRWAFPEVRPKVGFHLWPKVGFSPLVGFHGAKGGLFLSECLRGCKGRLPGLAEKPNKAFFGQRWAFPCLTVFKTARRLNLSLYGAKVGFHASKDPEDCQDCQRWASMVPKVGFSPLVGFEASKVGLFPVLPKVGFEGGLFGLIWLILAFSLESYLLYILYTL
jgi:hypothetical protein